MNHKDFYVHVWENMEGVNIMMDLHLTRKQIIPIKAGVYPTIEEIKIIEDKIKGEFIAELKDYIKAQKGQ